MTADDFFFQLLFREGVIEASWNTMSNDAIFKTFPERKSRLRLKQAFVV